MPLTSFSARHVHGFLKEIGQGIQHVASRVENLVEFVQRCNDMRDITGEVRHRRGSSGMIPFHKGHEGAHTHTHRALFSPYV
jgi:hypothetical protein